MQKRKSSRLQTVKLSLTKQRRLRVKFLGERVRNCRRAVLLPDAIYYAYIRSDLLLIDTSKSEK